MNDSTPTIRVRACIAIIENGKILMTPHVLDGGKIKWHLPGGGVHYDETTRQAAERELQEETGYIGIADELIDMHEVFRLDEKYHGISLMFKGERIGGELAPEVHPIYGTKTSEWLSKDDLADITYNRKEIIDRLMGII